MTTVEQESLRFGAEGRAPTIWGRIDQALETIGDRVNPILVREARQAIKSRQFLITFTLLLVAVVGWTFIGVAANYREHVYRPRPIGLEMLLGYACVLGFPLFIVVPFAANRSLSAEMEEGSFDLLSITTLRARQIIAGKLAIAMLQMTVYLSVLAPCLAFSYVVRGVDLTTIGYVLFYTVASSIGLSIFGLLVAATMRERFVQALSIVASLAVFGGAYWGAAAILFEFFDYGEALPADDPAFWTVNASIVAVAGCLFWLAFEAAAAQITFASENRSTRLRVVMTITAATFHGALLGPMIAYNGGSWWVGEAMIFISFTVAALYWGLLGSLMIGERPELSRRAQRSLPESFLGRVFLTWLNPGPGTGFFFVLGNMLALAATIAAALSIAGWLGLNRDSINDSAVLFAVAITCYVVLYLGAARIFVRALAVKRRPSILLGPLLILAMIMFGVLAPMMLAILDYSLMRDYSILHIGNPFWSLAEVAEGPFRGGNRHGTEIIVLLSFAALGMVAIQVVLAIDELRLVRSAAPERVQTDDAVAIPVTPESPWD